MSRLHMGQRLFCVVTPLMHRKQKMWSQSSRAGCMHGCRHTAHSSTGDDSLADSLASAAEEEEAAPSAATAPSEGEEDMVTICKEEEADVFTNASRNVRK